MPRKLNNKIASTGQIVNIIASLTLVLIISVGYFGTIASLPMAA